MTAIALFQFQVNNPLWPDAQPWDTYFLVGVAVPVVWINRRAMLTRDGAVTEIFAPENWGPFIDLKRILLTATAYVAAVFAAGFMLGVLRTLVLVPLLGELAAVLAELPLILTVAWLVCTRILRRWPLSHPSALGMGAIAFLMLMGAEAGLSTLLAGRSLVQHVALYLQLPHQLGLAGQLAFALFPWIQARRTLMPPG